MSYVLAKAFDLKAADYQSLPMVFPDVPASNTYASSIKAIYYNGITNGSDGKYMPKSAVTRAQFASFIARAKSDKYRLDLPEIPEASRYISSHRYNCGDNGCIKCTYETKYKCDRARES